jgi:hypothetical protein
MIDDGEEGFTKVVPKRCVMCSYRRAGVPDNTTLEQRRVSWSEREGIRCLNDGKGEGGGNVVILAS